MGKYLERAKKDTQLSWVDALGAGGAAGLFAWAEGAGVSGFFASAALATLSGALGAVFVMGMRLAGNWIAAPYRMLAQTEAENKALRDDNAAMRAAAPAAGLSVSKFADQWSVVVENTGGVPAVFEAKVQLVGVTGPHRQGGASVKQHIANLSPSRLVPHEVGYFAVGEHLLYENHQDGDRPASLIVAVTPNKPSDAARLVLCRANVVSNQPVPSMTIKVTITAEPTLQSGYLIQFFQLTVDGLVPTATP